MIEPTGDDVLQALRSLAAFQATAEKWLDRDLTDSDRLLVFLSWAEMQKIEAIIASYTTKGEK